MNIIVFQTAFLGDLILSLPFLKKILEKYKPNNLFFVFREEYIELLKYIKLDISPIALKKQDNIVLNYLALKKNIENVIEKVKIDKAFLLQKHIRVAILAYLLNISERYGFCYDKLAKLFYTKCIDYEYRQGVHEIEKYFLMIDEKFTINDLKYEWFDFSSLKLSLENDYIVFNVDANILTKQWSIENYLKLSIKLLENIPYLNIYFTGQKDVLKNEVEDFFKDNKKYRNRVKNLIGETTILEYIYIIKKARLLLSGDTSAVHIASLYNTPTIVIYGPTKSDFGFFPLSEKSDIIEKDIACRGCRVDGYVKKCKYDFACLKNININEVLNKILYILEI